ncbi:Calpain small subunit 1, partial [Ophiophagus hannah]
VPCIKSHSLALPENVPCQKLPRRRDAAAQYNPEPPPPRSHFSNIEANESEEDMEVSATELMNIMNKVVTRHPDLKTDGFGIDTCRSMVAVMDCDTTGKLGFEEFKYLWNNIKKWQCIYKQYDADRSGTIGSRELPGAFEAAALRHDCAQVLGREREHGFRQLHQLPGAPGCHVP